MHLHPAWITNRHDSRASRTPMIDIEHQGFTAKVILDLLSDVEIAWGRSKQSPNSARKPSDRSGQIGKPICEPFQRSRATNKAPASLDSTLRGSRSLIRCPRALEWLTDRLA